MLKKKIRWLSMAICVLFISTAFSGTIDSRVDNTQSEGNKVVQENAIMQLQLKRNDNTAINSRGCIQNIVSFLQPTVVITSPDNGSVFTEPGITLTGYAVDEIGIDYINYTHEWEEGTNCSSWTIDPPVGYYEFAWGLVLYEGWNRIKVTAGNVNEMYGCDEVTVYYNPEEEDTESPVVVIEYPPDGSIFFDPIITVTGYATDNVGITIIGVYHEWEGGEASTSRDVDPPQTYVSFEVVNLELRSNWNRITVFAEDASGNNGSDEVTVYYFPEENWPPYPSENPSPSKGAYLVNIYDVDLSWTCFDPDLDDLKYIVLFEAWDSTPDVNISWQSDASYALEDLESNTHYYWQIIADDGEGGVTEGPIWDFTTRDIDPPEAYFITPKEKHLYFFGRDIGFIGITIIIGPIDIEVHAEDTVGIYSVEFYVDDELKAIKYYPPYFFSWRGRGFHYLMAKVTDSQYNFINISESRPGIFLYVGKCIEPSISLWPYHVTWGPTGTLVPSIKTAGAYLHYVSPVKGYNPPDDPDEVIIKAFYDLGTCKPLPSLRWIVPTGVTTTGEMAKVPRSNPGKYVLKAELVAGGVVKAEDTMIVWIVKAEVTMGSKPAPNPKMDPVNTTANSVRIRGNISFVHTIKPASIITDADRPNLAGPNTVAPPNATGAGVSGVGKSLAGGADKRWDSSRQIRCKVFTDNLPQILKDWVNSPGRKLYWTSYLNWPTKSVVGNDDYSTGDEKNDPYSSNPKGILNGSDRPSRRMAYIHSWDRDEEGHTAEVRLQFKEFSRLQIGEGWFKAGEGWKTGWYRISDYFIWRETIKFKSRSEKSASTDFNGDGDKKDLVFIDDGSIIELNHNGW